MTDCDQRRLPVCAGGLRASSGSYWPSGRARSSHHILHIQRCEEGTRTGRHTEADQSGHTTGAGAAGWLELGWRLGWRWQVQGRWGWWGRQVRRRGRRRRQQVWRRWWRRGRVRWRWRWRRRPRIWRWCSLLRPVGMCGSAWSPSCLCCIALCGASAVCSAEHPADCVWLPVPVVDCVTGYIGIQIVIYRRSSSPLQRRQVWRQSTEELVYGNELTTHATQSIEPTHPHAVRTFCYTPHRLHTHGQHTHH